MNEVQDNFFLNRNEVRRIFTRGTGAGGQHKNTTDSCVILTHIPTGIEVKIDGRNQHQNEREAWIILEERLRSKYVDELSNQLDDDRNSQIGGGERGNKKRTYRVKDNLVVDHITGRKAQLRDIIRGRIELLK
jgi:protein subunit release factor A